MSEQPPIDSATFRRVLGNYPTGVAVVTAIGADGAPLGMVVGSFTSVSLDPPLVAFLPDKRSTTWPRIEAAGKFYVNVLAADQKPLCRVMATSGADKFAGVSHSLSGNGSPVLDGIVAWIDCSLHAVHEAGDHFIAIGQVLGLDVVRPQRPLLFFQGSYGEFAVLPPEDMRAA